MSHFPLAAQKAPHQGRGGGAAETNQALGPTRAPPARRCGGLASASPSASRERGFPSLWERTAGLERLRVFVTPHGDPFMAITPVTVQTRHTTRVYTVPSLDARLMTHPLVTRFPAVERGEMGFLKRFP